MKPLWPDQIEIFYQNFGYRPKSYDDAREYLLRKYPGGIGDVDPFEPVDEAMEPFLNEFGIEE